MFFGLVCMWCTQLSSSLFYVIDRDYQMMRKYAKCMFKGGWGANPSGNDHISHLRKAGKSLTQKCRLRGICDRSQEGISHVSPRVLYKSILATCVREVRKFDLRLPKSGVFFNVLQ